MAFNDDYEAAQLAIDLNTIAADDHNEMLNLTWDSIDTSVADDIEQLGSATADEYAGFSFDRINILAERKGLSVDMYLDGIADMRERIMQARPFALATPKGK